MKLKTLSRFRIPSNIYTATICQFAVAMLFLWISRFIFYLANADITGVSSFSDLMKLAVSGFRFDLSAAAWLNIPFIAMRMIPFRLAENRKWLAASDIIFAIANSAGLLANLADTGLFRFTGARMRFDSLSGWINEGNLGGILLSYAGECWWLYLLAAAMITLMLWIAFRFKIERPVPELGSRASTFTLRLLIFIIAATASVFAMRGVIKGHPLKISDAIKFTENMAQVPLVQNTPFCIMRTIGKGTDELVPLEFFSEAELASIRTSLHDPAGNPDHSPAKGKNIFVIVIESGGAVWSDILNVYPSDRTATLTPFIDSIASESLRVRHVFAAGKGTIDGITTIFGGFPSVSPFQYMTSPYVGNNLDSPARLLHESGYTTKFYLGSEPGSCNIDQFLKISGFKDVTSCNDYPSRKDHDGAWGIFDHAMGAYAARDLSTLTPPFFAGWLTLNPHMPFNVPDYWNASDYRSDKGTASRAAEYMDRSLRNFFSVAKSQPWYSNTVFIITSDHGTRDFKQTPHDSPWIQPHIFFIVHTPDGSIPPGEVSDRVMSQHDITPTILSLAGYDKTFVALGSDIFSDTHAPYALSMIGGRIQIIGTRWMVQLSSDMKRIEGVFDILKDPTASHPAGTFDSKEIDSMVRWGKAFMQDFTQRTVNHRMSVNPGTSVKTFN